MPVDGTKVRLTWNSFEAKLCYAFLFVNLALIAFVLSRPSHCSLTMEMSASGPSLAQLFYDVGRGFNEQDSATVPVTSNSLRSFQRLSFALPEKTLLGLRFDPLANEGRVVIRNMVIEKRNTVVKAFPISKITSLNQIANRVEHENEVEFSTVAGANDPGLRIVTGEPLKLRGKFVTRDFLRLGILDACLVCVCLLLWATQRQVLEACEKLVRVAHAIGAFLLRLPEVGWRSQIGVFVIGFLAVVSRRPDALLNAQFYGEDGSIWFPEAYMFGWGRSLLHPQNAYFQTLPRLAVSLALLVPLQFAPLLTNVIGITLQVLPVNVLLSSRCRNWGPLWVRALMAFIYIGLPNTRELNATITEGQWHLALLVCLVVLAYTPRTISGRILDVGATILCGLSGPFSMILLPIAACFWWLRRERWRLVPVGLLAVTAAIQFSAFMQNAEATRSQVGLGATPKLFGEILGGQVFLGAMLGEKSSPTQHGDKLLVLAAFMGTCVVAYCVMRAQLEIKLFLCFAFLVFAASLRNPMASLITPQWEILKIATGVRYWFFPMLGFCWALVWCLAASRNVAIQSAVACCLLVMGVGIRRDWLYPAYTDFHFRDRARQFQSAQAGTLVSIPIYPDGWAMRLTKKGPLCRNVPIGHVDEPAPGSNVIGPVTVRGWAAAVEPIQRVSIIVDGSPVSSVALSGRRPDVDGSYPWFRFKDKEWASTVDLSKLSPGPHEISVRAVESSGCDAEFDAISITKGERAPK